MTFTPTEKALQIARNALDEADQWIKEARKHFRPTGLNSGLVFQIENLKACRRVATWEQELREVETMLEPADPCG